MSKEIQLGSGSFIRRIPQEGYDETWEIESKSMAKTEVTLDLTKCSGIEVEAFDGEEGEVSPLKDFVS